MEDIGKKRVMRPHNPNADKELVNAIKQKTAELITLCEEFLKPKDPRAAAIAQTEYESASHWAVKAATTPEE